MYLQLLNLINFKNYEDAQFEFTPGTNCLLGPNGVGKTNLLDAIHYLSFTKSAFNSVADGVRHGAEAFALKGSFNIDKQCDEVICTYSAVGGKKRIRINGTEQAKKIDHIGKYPSVLIAPQGIELVWGGSRLRRNFFDALIAQLDKSYLENLIVYTSQLKQRNSALKNFAAQPVDHDLLDVYDREMTLTGAFLHRKRSVFISKFMPFFRNHYAFLMGNRQEEVDVKYRSELTGKDIEHEFKMSRQRDLLLQRTSIGVHRDDFELFLNGYPLKYIGSQGQQKAFLISLKIAEFQFIEQKKGFKPLLLLDDIFDKLDEERTDKLLSLITGGLFGQLFITDAHYVRNRALLQRKGLGCTLFELKYDM